MKHTFALLFALLAQPVSAAFISTHAQHYMPASELPTVSGRVTVQNQLWDIPHVELGQHLVLDANTAPSYGFDWEQLNATLHSQPSFFLGVTLFQGVNGLAGGSYDTKMFDNVGPSDFPGQYIESVVWNFNFNEHFRFMQATADMNVVPEASTLVLALLALLAAGRRKRCS